jgi:hypothetical protein
MSRGSKNVKNQVPFYGPTILVQLWGGTSHWRRIILA